MNDSVEPQPVDSLPIVSVVIPTRNRYRTLQRTLQSIAKQTLREFEVLVVDDGSSAEALREYDKIMAEFDNRFRLYKQAVPDLEGTGPAATRNRGIRVARGEYLAFCDDDDWWSQNNHLAVGIAVLNKTEGDAYFTNMQAQSHDQVTIPDWFPHSPQLTRGKIVHNNPPVHNVDLPNLMATMRHHYPSFNTCILRRGAVETEGGFWERLRCAEDIDLIMRVFDRCGQAYYRPQCAVTCDVSPRDSTFTGTSKVELGLYGVSAAQHVRALCRHGVVRRCARAIEAWNLRQVAGELAAAGHLTAASSMAWQAVCIYPTLGAKIQWTKISAKALCSAMRGIKTGDS